MPIILIFLSGGSAVVTILSGIVLAARWIIRTLDRRIEEGISTELRDHMAAEERQQKKLRKRHRRLEKAFVEHTKQDTANFQAVLKRLPPDRDSSTYQV